MVQVLMVKMLMQKWELKKIIGLEQINLVEIYGHVHGKALKFLVIGIVALLDIFIGVVYGAISGFLVGE